MLYVITVIQRLTLTMEYVHLLMICFISGACCYTLDQLIKDVFDGYEMAVRPRCDVTSATNVTMDMALRQIIELDEPHQVLNIIVWFRLRWYDCRLSWNASEYGGIDSFVVNQKRVWVPDLTLYDTSASGKLSGIDDYNLQINSDGSISYQFPSIIKSLCAVDVSHFPFDYQACKLTFGSWAYNGRQVDLYNKSHAADMTSYVQNTEWSVPGVPAIRKTPIFDDNPYPIVSYIIRLERRPLFYALNLLFPCFLISSVAILGFLLPPASGEKVNLEITVMLSLAVFQLIVLELMPPTGDTLPFIGIYFISSMVLVGLSCLATVIVLNIHFKGNEGTSLPPWVLRYVYYPLSKLTCTKREIQKLRHNSFSKVDGHLNLKRDDTADIPDAVPMNQTDSNDCIKTINYAKNDIASISYSGAKNTCANKSNIISSLYEANTLLKSIDQHLQESTDNIHVGEDWRTLALMLDRLFMAVYVTLLLTCGVTLSVIYISSRDRPDVWGTFE